MKFVHDIDTLLDAFQNPPPEYGPIDCWWWEGAEVSKEKMRQQLEDMKAKGVHGTWYYPRFLSGEPLQSKPAHWTEEWWDVFKFSLQEHKRLGLKACFSDWTAFEFFQDMVRDERSENPRLTGRRLVCYQQSSGKQEKVIGEGPGYDIGPDYRMHAGKPSPLLIEVPAEEEILLAAAYKMTAEGLEYASQINLLDSVVNNSLSWAAPDLEWMLVVITAQPNDLNYLDPIVAERWLDVQLGEFERRLPEYLGNTLEAYGPDEMFIIRGNILYSPDLLARFQRKKGYNPLPYLSGIFFDIGMKTEKIRCDYYEVMVDLLDENFYKPIADWLHAHGMKYATIATWGRVSPTQQTSHYGDFFRMLRHFDMPGNEDPDDSTEAYDVTERKFIDAKFSSSIAHLGGHERSAVCAYWGSGWGATQQQNIAFTLANYAYGHNFYNGHGAMYSTLGGWYEWVPPSIHFRQPYWEYWKYFTDWLRRLGSVMSKGDHVADIALFYPLTTLHAGWTGGDNFSEAAKEAAQKVMSLATAIYRGGLDFDFVDDLALSQAEIVDGRLSVAGHAFKALVLPPLNTIHRGTLQKLQAFQKAGGVVLSFGRLPDTSPEQGREDSVIISLAEEMFAETNSRGIFVPLDEMQVPQLISKSIEQDVVVSEPMVFHNHHKVGETDILLLMNMLTENRSVTITIKACGEPEKWDPFTGNVYPVVNYENWADTTTVQLHMAPHQGILLVFKPSKKRQIPVDKQPVASQAAEIRLDGPWTISLQPTMDNRWGDFRYPPSDEMIGPEARQFHYREEIRPEDGIPSNWEQLEFDDSGWQQVRYSYGPYWWTLGPFGEANDPKQILNKITEGGFDSKATFELASRSFGWEPLSFSQQFGSWEGMKRGQSFGGLEGIADDFLALEGIPGGQSIVRYLFTYVIAPEAGDWILDFGGQAQFPRQAWVNGQRVIGEVPIAYSSSKNSHYQSINKQRTVSGAVEGSPDNACEVVRLQKGINTLLLRIVQPEGKALSTYAVLYDPAEPPAAKPRIPLLRWFREPQQLSFDLTPGQTRIGWYRFTAPPGLRSLRCKLHAAEVEVWVDGNPAAISFDGSEVKIELDEVKKHCSQIAFRLKHFSGRYGGAAIGEPISFTCEKGIIQLGDWCEYGLETYSGATIYSQVVNLNRDQLDKKITLDLGTVATACELSVNGKSAGVGMAQPFRFNIGNLLQEGKNLIEVRVVNTLANHMSSYPTRFIYPGQLVSGLLGPVRIIIN